MLAIRSKAVTINCSKFVTIRHQVIRHYLPLFATIRTIRNYSLFVIREYSLFAIRVFQTPFLDVVMQTSEIKYSKI